MGTTYGRPRIPGNISSPGFIAPSTWPSRITPVRLDASNLTLTNVTLDVSSPAHTKVSWVEAVASLPEDIDWIRLGSTTAASASGVNNSALLDVGVGGAGSETALVNNVGIAGQSSFSPWCNVIDLPIRITAGTRLALRQQTARTANGAVIFMAFGRVPDDGVPFATSIDTIGANTATSAGVSLGSTTNVWTEITSSTSRAYRGIVVCPTTTDTSMANSTVGFDLGIGPSGSEVAYPIEQVFNTTSSEYMLAGMAGSLYVPVTVPAGSRLAVRYIDPSASNTGYTAVLLGIPV